MMVVMMARNRIRAASLGTAAATRTFSTASPSGEDKRLYRRLSALGATPGGSVAGVMDEWLKEGKAVTESKLVNIVKELRKYKSYNHALKVMGQKKPKCPNHLYN